MHAHKDYVQIAARAWDLTKAPGDPAFFSENHNPAHRDVLVHAVESVIKSGSSGQAGHSEFEQAVKDINNGKVPLVAPAPVAIPAVADEPDAIDGEIVETPLPDDFPYKSVFEAADVTTVEGVESLLTLTDVPGIGPGRAAEVEAYLKKSKN